MTISALQACLDREHAQALAASALDNVLGTHHGLSWADFVLLEHLAQKSAGMPEAELAKRMGLLRSRLLVRTRPLEKLGWLLRVGGGPRLVALRPSGQRLLEEARETAAAACANLGPDATPAITEQLLAPPPKDEAEHD